MSLGLAFASERNTTGGFDLQVTHVLQFLRFNLEPGNEFAKTIVDIIVENHGTKPRPLIILHVGDIDLVDITHKVGQGHNDFMAPLYEVLVSNYPLHPMSPNIAECVRCGGNDSLAAWYKDTDPDVVPFSLYETPLFSLGPAHIIRLAGTISETLPYHYNRFHYKDGFKSYFYIQSGGLILFYIDDYLASLQRPKNDVPTVGDVVNDLLTTLENGGKSYIDDPPSDCYGNQLRLFQERHMNVPDWYHVFIDLDTIDGQRLMVSPLTPCIYNRRQLNIPLSSRLAWFTSNGILSKAGDLNPLLMGMQLKVEPVEEVQ